ncbi:hypothetical protein Hypma_004568 [Hypsizygus marmoreus]|uniref:Uncharacterized protein n=1 Tax=Hypsizygus marmoreus TaxID=39966 RepID=A0A369K0P2_HYPMA|nr:hypothetical protein Hypma_004568 [Hypsizygus marmoreus]
MAAISINLVRWACLLSILFLATMNVDAGSNHGTSPTRILSAEDLIRVRASTDERKSTVVEWEGQVLSYKPGEQPAVIFNVRGMNVVRAKKLPNGSYDLLGRELQLYLDPVTNEVLHVWTNPFSGNTVPVVHVANNPVYQNFPAASTYSARGLPGGAYTFQLSIPLAYPNPLNPTASPDSPFYRYTGPYQAKYSAIESFTFTFPGSELASRNSKSVPSMQVYWTRTSPLLPFMDTPNTNTTLLFIATGSKVQEGWKGLHPTVKNVIKNTLPAYKEAPTERLSPGGGVTSWSYFAKPEVFSAYLAGATFPLPDPPV